MIKYALRCSQKHEFESWFRDSGSFDSQKAEGFVACPVCGSTEVDKALMAPAVVSSKARDRIKQAAPDPMPTVAPAAPVAASSDENAEKMRGLLRAMRDQVLQHSRDVGTAFAEEARRIHDGDGEKESIHGQASPEDVRSLIEDGIEVMPLPIFPDERN